MNTNGGSGESIEQGIHIGVEASDDASPVFKSILDAYNASAEAARNANETTARAAEDAGQRVSEALKAQAVSMREVDELRARVAAGTAQSAAAVDEDTAASGRYVAQIQREIAALRDLERQGQITAEQRVQSTKDLALQVPQSRGDELLSRDTIHTGAVGGNQDMIARQRALIAVDKEVEVAERDLTTAVTIAARDQAAAIRDGVRLGQISREEEATQLRELRKEYESYADARIAIDKRITENMIAQNNEQAKAQREKQSGVGDFALNAGYLLPGAAGNALTNLGYFAQDGPGMLAVGGAAVAGIGAGAGILAAADAAGKAQEAMSRLSIAVKDQGGDWASLESSVEAFVETQTKTTTFGRDETVPALLQLVNAGMKLKDAFDVVRVAEDASAATGKPLQSVVEGLQHAYEGNARSLISLGLINKNEAKDGTIQFGDALVLVEKRMRDQATAVDEYTKQQKLLKDQIDELVISIGTGLLPKMEETTKSTNAFVASLNGKAIGEGIASAADGTLRLAGAFGQLFAAFKPVADLYSTVASYDIKFNETLLGGVKTAIDWAGQHPGGILDIDGQNERVNQGGGGLPAPSLGLPAGYDIATQIANAANANADGTGLTPQQLAAVLYAIDAQETAHGKSSNYDSVTGLDKDGNRGHGRFQLDPASGASADDLNRAATDVGFAANKAAEMLAKALRDSHGNLTAALADYNAGGLNAKGLAYANSVLGQIPSGSSLLNAAPSERDLRNIQGSAQIGTSRGAPSELEADRAKYLTEQREGITTWRQDYENALKAIADDESKNAKERNQAEIQYDALIKQDKAAEARDVAAAARVAEANYKAQLDHTEALAKSGKETNEQEIASLQKLMTAREAQGGANEADDVQRLSDKIAELQNRFTATLAQLGKTYKDTGESLDDYIAKVRTLERGANPLQKQAGDAAIDAAIEASVAKDVATIKTAYDNAIKQGLSRPDQEAAARSALSALGGVRNYGDTTAGDSVTNAGAGFNRDLGTNYASDASDAVTALDQKYKELFTDISDGTASAVQKDQQQIALYQQQTADLAALALAYKNAYGSEATDAVAKLDTAIQDLAVKQHDLTDQTARDERKALADRATEYQQFTQSAEQHLLSLFNNGKKGMTDFRDVFKTVLKEIESDAAGSIFKSLFGGGGAVGGGFNPLNSLETAVFGSVAPAGYFQSITGGGSASASTTNALATQAYTKIAASTKGTADDPHVVTFAPGVMGGPGGSTTPLGGNSATAYGALGLIFGPAASGMISQIPTSGGVGGLLLGTAFTSLVSQATSNSSSATNAGTGGNGAPSGLSAIGLGGVSPLSLLGIGSSSGFSGSASANNPFASLGLGMPGTNVSPLSSLFGSGSASRINPQTDPQLYGISAGAASTSKIVGNLFQGLGVGAGVASVDGGNSSNGAIGGLLGGIAGVLTKANPIAGLALDIGGGLIGSLFGNHTTAATSPDIYDTSNYGNDIASLIGKQAGANGTTFLPSAQLLGATNNLGEISYIEELLSKGQTAFTDSTGLTAAQYQTALGFFGSSATGSGTLQHGKNIGQLTVSGATGDGTTLSYTAAQALAAQILQGQQSGGSLGLPGTYTISRSNPDYNIGTVNAMTIPAIAQAAATITGTSPGYGTTTGLANPSLVSVNSGTAAQLGSGTTSGQVVVDARGATFAGVGGISDLADMINAAMQRKASGSLPNKNVGYRVRAKNI